MFSTMPIAPIASTFALRPASACIRPTTQAAPAMSPFMSSMPDGRLDGDAAGVECHALADERDRLGAARPSVLLSPFQRMTTMRPGRDDPWLTPTMAPMPSACMAGMSRMLDFDAKRLERLGAIREDSPG